MRCICDKIRFCASYKGGSELEKRPPSPTLTEPQAVVILEQWELLKTHIANLGVITYVRLLPLANCKLILSAISLIKC